MMGFPEMDLVRDHSKLTGLSRFLLYAIARHINNGEGAKYPGQTFVGRDKLMAAIGVGYTKDFYRLQKLLVDSGELILERDAGPGRTHLRSLNLDSTDPEYVMPPEPEPEPPTEAELQAQAEAEERRAKERVKREKADARNWVKAQAICGCHGGPHRGHHIDEACGKWTATDRARSPWLYQEEAAREREERRAALPDDDDDI